MIPVYARCDIVGVSDDERMQSRNECRRGDAETRGRAEAETKPEEQSSEKSSAEKSAEQKEEPRRKDTKPKTGRVSCDERETLT